MRVQCRTCGRPTFAGCGAHVEQVLRDVPREQRCRCREESTSTSWQQQKQKQTPPDPNKRSRP